MPSNGFTLGELKTLALDLAEMSTGFIVAARQNDYANMALGLLHDLVVRSKQDYFKQEVDFSIASGTEEYALPDDFYKDLGVFYMSGTDRIPLTRFNPRSTTGFRVPNTSATVRLWYVPQFTRLVADDQEIHPIIPRSWELYACLCMAELCMMRAKLDPSHILAKKQAEHDRIVEMLEPRGESDTASVEDTVQRFGPPYPVNFRGLCYAVVGHKLHILQEWPPSR